MRKRLLVTLGIIVASFLFNYKTVYALSEPIEVIIKDGVITASISNNTIDNYEDYFTFDGNKFLIKEGTVIKKITTDVSLEITSNNKEVVMGELNHSEQNIITINYKELNSINSNVLFKTSSSNTYYEINNSTINNFDYILQYTKKSEQGYGLIIRKSTINFYNKNADYYNEIYIHGAILLEDSDYYAGPLHSEYNTVTIKNSNYYSSGQITAEEPEGKILIDNSILENVKTKNYLGLYVSAGSMKNQDTIIIKDSKLTGVSIYNNSDNNTKVINSTIDFFDKGYVNASLYNSLIENSTLKLYGTTTLTIFGTIKDSKIIGVYNLNMYRSDDGKNNIINTVFEDAIGLSIYQDTIIKKSKFNVNGYMSLGGNIDITDSYIKVDNKDSKAYTDNALYTSGNISITNSYLYLLSKSDGTALIGKDNSIITIDGNIFDLEGNKLYQIKTEDGVYYSKNKDGSEKTQSLTIIPDINITFKVKNGTWADGTTDDIVIKLSAWDTLKNGNIPIDMIALNGFISGSWDITPNTFDELTEDMVFTYTFKESEEVKGVEENPKTGLFNDILLFIPVIISILGFNYLKRLELFKKM